MKLGDLRFDITADNSAFNRAMKRAEETHRAAAVDMGNAFAGAAHRADTASRDAAGAMNKHFEQASKASERSWVTMAQNAIAAVEKFASAIRGVASQSVKEAVAGADGVEKAFKDGFNKAFETAFDKSWARIKGKLEKGGPIGQTLGLAMTGAEEFGIKDALAASLKTSTAGGLSGWADSLDVSKYTSKLRDALVAAGKGTSDAFQSAFDAQVLTEAQARVETWADAIKQSVDDAAESVKISLKRIAGLWEGVSDAVKKAADAINDRSRAVEAQTALIGVGTGQRAALQARAEMLRAVGKAYSELNDAERQEVESAEANAATAAMDAEARQRGVEALKRYDEALTSLTKRNENARFQSNMAGASPQERAEASEFARLLEQLGDQWGKLSEKQKTALAEGAKTAGFLAQEAEDRRKATQEAERYAIAVQSVAAALKRQGEFAMANAGAGQGKSAYDRALERGRALADSYGSGRTARLADAPAVQAANRAAAELQQQAANDKFNYDLAEAIRQQTAAYDIQTRSLGAAAGEAERMKFIQTEINKAFREGVPVTDGLRAMIDASATALARAAQEAALARERFEQFRQVGQTVASSLESAFDKWISGTRFNFSDLIRSMSQDLARLTVRRGLETLLTGSPASGGGVLSSLFSLFGGYRADGGDVSAGKTYVVGERGPELFVPRGSGSIVANGALAGGGPQVINMRIDLAGANGDETIARIAGAAAKQAFAAAVAQANAMAPSRQRQFQMLGA